MDFELPPLLIEMMNDGRWVHPGSGAMARIAPFIEEELVFRTSMYEIPIGHECLMGPEENQNEIFHEYRGSKFTGERELPWIDVERSALIAINRIPGDDIALALDFRTSTTNPRVVGNEWSDGGYSWREVAPTFDAFAKTLTESTQAQNKRPHDNP